MLFNSFEFLFAFLPISLLAFHLIRIKYGGKLAKGILILLSLAFYAWWNYPYLLLLCGTIAANYGFSHLLWHRQKALFLALAIGMNLALLGYFKYKNFFLENLSILFNTDWKFSSIFIPLAISFFIFQQIAFLIDVRDGRVKKQPFSEFVLFVSFFPQLIAGPIVLHREIREQFEAIGRNAGAGLSLLGPGIVIFSVGLFKKIVLADSLAPYSDLAFNIVDRLTLLEAWAAAIAFSLQIYFDFSGYADMAVGLGLMFGIALPLNFNTPFRATSMIDFWKRWHITMTRFFMMYLYTPMGLHMTRLAHSRGLTDAPAFLLGAALPMMITFLLSGLWHGAAWTFVIFGAVNAFGLIVNHAWKQFGILKLPPLLGWVLTMLVVIVSFVYFRADSMEDANRLIALMFSFGDIILPNWLSGLAESLDIPWQTLNYFATGSYTVRLAFWLFVCTGFVFFLPNVAAKRESLVPGWRTAAGTAAILWLAIGLLDRPQAFIYFQF